MVYRKLQNKAETILVSLWLFTIGIAIYDVIIIPVDYIPAVIVPITLYWIVLLFGLIGCRKRKMCILLIYVCAQIFVLSISLAQLSILFGVFAGYAISDNISRLLPFISLLPLHGFFEIIFVLLTAASSFYCISLYKHLRRKKILKNDGVYVINAYNNPIIERFTHQSLYPQYEIEETLPN